MQLTSKVFADHASIPRRHTCDGENVSPPLAWSHVPPDARSLVLLCDDPDAPAGTWHHWAAYDIDIGKKSMAEGEGNRTSATGFQQAINDFHAAGYGGPCPPRGDGPHRYHFRLLALSVDRLPVTHDPSCVRVERAARAHVLAEAVLVGIYER